MSKERIKELEAKKAEQRERGNLDAMAFYDRRIKAVQECDTAQELADEINGILDASGVPKEIRASQGCHLDIMTAEASPIFVSLMSRPKITIAGKLITYGYSGKDRAEKLRNRDLLNKRRQELRDWAVVALTTKFNLRTDRDGDVYIKRK